MSLFRDPVVSGRFRSLFLSAMALGLSSFADCISIGKILRPAGGELRGDEVFGGDALKRRAEAGQRVPDCLRVFRGPL